MIEYENLDIVFLTKEVPDYLHDAIYMGLQELGCNVVDTPRKRSLHGEVYPKGSTSLQLMMDLPNKELRKTPDIMIITALASDITPEGPDAWMRYVKNTVSEYQPKKIVILDGQDKPDCLYPVLDREYDAIFKREMCKAPYSNWYGINFSAIPETFEFVPYPYREYDVSVMMGISCQYRVDIAKYIKEVATELDMKAYVHLSNSLLPRNEYLRILSQSKTCLSVRGMGWDCYRYWEIPAKGCVLLSEYVPILIENDFTQEHCFKFNNKEDLKGKLYKIKQTDPYVLQNMALKSLSHTYKYHTPRERARQMVDKIFMGA